MVFPVKSFYLMRVMLLIGHQAAVGVETRLLIGREPGRGLSPRLARSAVPEWREGWKEAYRRGGSREAWRDMIISPMQTYIAWVSCVRLRAVEKLLLSRYTHTGRWR